MDRINEKNPKQPHTIFKSLFHMGYPSFVHEHIELMTMCHLDHRAWYWIVVGVILLSTQRVVPFAPLLPLAHWTQENLGEERTTRRRDLDPSLHFIGMDLLLYLLLEE
jgi:hypothetical protein